MSSSVDAWTAQAVRRLTRAGIGTARLDALVLLEDCVGVDRGLLLAHPERELSPDQTARLEERLRRRLRHEPLAYVRGKTEFYGREYMIDHRVLEPRPESETIIDLLKSLSLPARPAIADIGTGSGALAITAKLELPHADVYAVDIDNNCLDIARQNAEKHQVAVSFARGDLLKPFGGKKFDVLLCNLPYVPDGFHINPAAMREPRIAIFGGPDGLDLYRRLFGQLGAGSALPAAIITEALPPQHTGLADIALAHGYRQLTARDLVQAFVTV